jgi:hypothetical protein
MFVLKNQHPNARLTGHSGGLILYFGTSTGECEIGMVHACAVPSRLSKALKPVPACGLNFEAADNGPLGTIEAAEQIGPSAADIDSGHRLEFAGVAAAHIGWIGVYEDLGGSNAAKATVYKMALQASYDARFRAAH